MIKEVESKPKYTLKDVNKKIRIMWAKNKTNKRIYGRSRDYIFNLLIDIKSLDDLYNPKISAKTYKKALITHIGYDDPDDGFTGLVIKSSGDHFYTKIGYEINNKLHWCLVYSDDALPTLKQLKIDAFMYNAPQE